MDYLLITFFTWLVTGITKFIINSWSEKRLAYDLIGYGGMPSNHSAIATSITALIALKEGIEHPAFGVALAFSFIVMLDASSLRNKVGEHARRLNNIAKQSTQTDPLLRERVGHSTVQIIAGIFTGILCAFIIYIT